MFRFPTHERAHANAADLKLHRFPALAQGGQRSAYIPDRLFAFGCVPLRSAVFLCALLGAFLGWMQLLARTYVHRHFLIFTGGYTLESRVVLDAASGLGAFACLAGVAGAYELRARQIWIYYGYLGLRLAASLWMYFNDVPVLMYCRTDVSLVHIPPGRCRQEMAFFFPCSAIALAALIYVTVCVQRLLADIEGEPPYLLRLGLEKPIGAPRSMPGYLRPAHPWQQPYGAAAAMPNATLGPVMGGAGMNPAMESLPMAGPPMGGMAGPVPEMLAGRRPFLV